jgi:hypothetical protein
MTPFLRELSDRAIKTGAQVYLGTVAASELFPADTVRDSIDKLGQGDKVSLAIIGIALSVLTSLLSRYVGDKDDASIL